MKVFLKMMVIVSTVFLIGCGEGTASTDEYVYELEYRGLKTKTEVLTKTNIPIYLDALDISGISDFVQIYVDLPYQDILANGKDISITTKGPMGGDQIINVHIVNSNTIELTHSLNNYMDESGSVDGTIKDTVSYVDADAEHTIKVDNLKVNYLDMHTVVEGVLTYSSQTGLETVKPRSKCTISLHPKCPL